MQTAFFSPCTLIVNHMQKQSFEFAAFLLFYGTTRFLYNEVVESSVWVMAV